MKLGVPATVSYISVQLDGQSEKKEDNKERELIPIFVYNISCILSILTAN